MFWLNLTAQPERIPSYDRFNTALGSPPAPMFQRKSPGRQKPCEGEVRLTPETVHMTTRGFSAYNLARGSLLNSKLTLADSGNQPLKLLDIVVSGMGMDPTAGLWLTPIHGTPAVPRVFPFDLVYLDKEYRVLKTAEMGPGIDFPLFQAEIASALVLPSDTLHRTNTAEGDRLIVCASNELEGLLAVSSLPSPDIAEAVPQAVVPALPLEPRAAKPGTIELTPERPIAPAPPPTAFEHSVLTAVAKVAETRNTEPKPLTQSHDATGPGPSIAVTEAVVYSSRSTQPAVIEHRIDPEDLFSNWVVAGPPPAAVPRTAPPEPPAAAKSSTNAVKTGSEAAKQNARKGRSPSESLAATRAASTRSSAAKAQAGSGLDNDAGITEKPASSPSTRTPGGTQVPAVQSFPATTFTTAPYGMWQVSMPTAVAQLTTAKSPQPVLEAPPSAGRSVPKPAEGPGAESAALKAGDAPGLNVVEEVRAPSLSSRPAAEPSVKAADPRRLVDQPKPTSREATAKEAHTPGDFAASLQQKLERVQQSRVVPKAEEASNARGAANTAAKTIPASLQPEHRSGAEAASSAGRPSLPKDGATPAVKSKAAPQPAPIHPKAGPVASGLRSKFRQWLHPTSSPSDRRRASRRYVPGMVAHYFTGGAPKPKNVADISMTGMYLLTDDRWMPGTMIQMTLQKPCASGEKKQSINVLSRVIRRGSDGVAAEFIMPEALPHISHDIQPSQATDRFALARFL